MEALSEVVALAYELLAGFVVVFFVFREDLHEVLGKGVYVPDAEAFFRLCYQMCVGGAGYAEAQSWDSVAFADAFDDEHVRVGFEHVVMQERVLLPSVREVDEAFVDNEAYAFLLAPRRQLAYVFERYEVS